jgi:hypothetical protein
MRTAIVAVAALALMLSACSGDNEPEGPLTEAAREWCTFTEATEEEALKFDFIFEAGLRLNLNMDVVNARADALRAEYEAQGLSADEAVKAVSAELFEIEEFVQACEAAYADEIGDS